MTNPNPNNLRPAGMQPEAIHPDFINEQTGQLIPLAEQRDLAAGWVGESKFNVQAGAGKGREEIAELRGDLRILDRVTEAIAQERGIDLDSDAYTRLQIESMELASQKQVGHAADVEAGLIERRDKPSFLVRAGAALQRGLNKPIVKALVRFGVPAVAVTAVAVGIATGTALPLAAAAPAILSKAAIGLGAGGLGKGAAHAASGAMRARHDRRFRNTETATRNIVRDELDVQRQNATRTTDAQDVYTTALNQAVETRNKNNADRRVYVTKGLGQAVMSGSVKGFVTGALVGSGMSALGFETPNFFGKWGALDSAEESVRKMGGAVGQSPTSPSPSVSPSTSTSPSLSPSPKVSPSTSPSMSPSASPSTELTPSGKPSTSPSVSPSPKVTPSTETTGKPSATTSTSPSPKVSPSTSPSMSPSASPSTELTPSGKPSTSPSVSPSPKVTPSPSVSPTETFKPNLPPLDPNNPGTGANTAPTITTEQAAAAEQAIIGEMMEAKAAEAQAQLKEAAAQFEGKGKNGWSKFQNAAGDTSTSDIKLSNRDTWYGIVGDGPDKGGVEGMNASKLFKVNMGGDATMTENGVKFKGNTWWIKDITAQEDVYITSADGKSSLFFEKGQKLGQNEQMAALKLLSQKGSTMVSAEDVREAVDKEFNPTPAELQARVQAEVDEITAEFDKNIQEATKANPTMEPNAATELQRTQIETLVNANADLLALVPDSYLKYFVQQLDARSTVPPQVIEEILEKALKKDLQLV